MKDKTTGSRSYLDPNRPRQSIGRLKPPPSRKLPWYTRALRTVTEYDPFRKPPGKIAKPPRRRRTRLPLGD